MSMPIKNTERLIFFCLPRHLTVCWFWYSSFLSAAPVCLIWRPFSSVWRTFCNISYNADLFEKISLGFLGNRAVSPLSLLPMGFWVGWCSFLYCGDSPSVVCWCPCWLWGHSMCLTVASVSLPIALCFSCLGTSGFGANRHLGVGVPSLPISSAPFSVSSPTTGVMLGFYIFSQVSHTLFCIFCFYSFIFFCFVSFRPLCCDLFSAWLDVSAVQSVVLLA